MSDDMELSEEAARILDAVLFTSRGDVGTTLPSTDLARFALGWMNEDESDRVTEWLIGHPTDRRRFVELRRQITQADISDQDLLDLLQGELSQQFEALKDPSKGRWSIEEMRRLAEREGRILQGVFAAVGQRLIRSTTPFSVMRGEAFGTRAGDLIESAVIGEDGDFIATVNLRGTSAGGPRVALDYLDPVLGAVTLAETNSGVSRWEIRVEGLASLLAVPPGRVPTSYLVVRESAVADPDSPNPPAPSWVAAIGEEGREQGWLPIPRTADPYIETIEGAPSRFVLPLAIPPSIVQAYPGYVLSAYLLMHPQPLLLCQETIENVARTGELSGPLGNFSGPIPGGAISLRLLSASDTG